jgi:Uma2 family endonuclease
VEDLQELPDDGRRYELVDGGLRVSPSPAWRHNGLGFRLARQLDAHCPSQLAVVAPGGGVPVPRGYLIPDLVVVEAALTDSASHAADPSQVLLAVEVASPSSGVDDVREKTDLYAEAGIASYWRVDAEREDRTSAGPRPERGADNQPT